MKTTVAVFFGGRSTEHEISVISALQAINAFDTDRYEVVPVYITKNGKWLTSELLTDPSLYKTPEKLEAQCEEVYMRSTYGDHNLYFVRTKGLFGKIQSKKIDVVFPVLHGSNGEDGVFQGLIENIGLPCAGCNLLASAVGMDKIMMKLILAGCNIPVVPFKWFTDKEWIANETSLKTDIKQKLGFPVIVKPANLGSSVGIGAAYNEEELARCVMNAINYSSRIIVEKMLEDMKEINCSVLGTSNECKASVLEEPIKTGKFLGYDDKYLGGSKGNEGMAASSKRIPAELTDGQTHDIKNLACETFRVLDCSGVSRVDIMIDNLTGKIYVNEINTIPGSLSYYLWEYTGITFTRLIDELIDIAFKQKREEDSKTTTYSLNIFNVGTLQGTKGVKGNLKSSGLK